MSKGRKTKDKGTSDTGSFSTDKTPASVPHGAQGITQNVPRSDKLDDKRISAGPDLSEIIKAWPELPKAIKKGILAMVRAAGKENE